MNTDTLIKSLEVT